MAPSNKHKTKARTDSQDDSKLDVCLQCDNGVKNDEKGIMCQKCFQWFHGRCLNISDDAVDLMGTIPGCYWYCADCNAPRMNADRLESETNKLSNLVSNLDLLIKKFPFPEAKSNLKESSSSSFTDEFKYQIRISGIPENKEQNNLKRQFTDKSVVDCTLK